MCDINQSDCCGNGCANCILDSKPLSTKRVDFVNKINILHTYRKYKLIKRIQPNNQPHLVQLKFAIADDKKQLTEFILDCPPGHHLMMRAPLLADVENIDNKTVLRPYSPFWTDITEFEFEIMVNLKPNGKMTKYIEKLKVNDEVEFRGPIGVFVYEPSFKVEKALFIFCQGVAIAPTIPIIENIIENEDDICRIYHYSCFENIDNIIFRQKLLEFNKFWNFSSKIFLSHQKCTECGNDCSVDCDNFKRQLKYKEQIKLQRLDKDTISTLLEEIKIETKQFVICGSNSFQNFITEYLRNCNVNKNCLYVL
ncbi:NADH-cytochrome b5 reductase-like [Episyrphus balteatus]|uniref:NADH-cytochrome b5 reductase-like n=1 Tax=Episyrphus balteatus TaxID=286459 RepID=UPI002485B730|nr:NADH-cytochrome b5 reductase-like [Episyrphus balteatus]